MKTRLGTKQLIELCETFGAHNYPPLPVVIEAVPDDRLPAPQRALDGMAHPVVRSERRRMTPGAILLEG